MKKSVLLLAILLITFTTTSQTLLRGTVIDVNSNQPILDAKIGITQQGVGVLSNNKGYFSYRKYDKVLDRDSKLLISAKGYESLELDIDQIREIYDTSAKIALTKGENSFVSNDNDIHVFWDVSEGMLGRDEEKELNFLENYLKQKGTTTVNFVVFNDKILFWKKDKVVDGNISRFRESIKNIGNIGPADYSLVQMEGAKEVLLFSNGNNGLGYLDAQQDVPVIIATTRDKYRDEARLKQIARYTSGKYLALDKQAAMPVAQNQGSKEKIAQQINGFVYSEGRPMAGAKIQRKGSFDEVVANQKGQFTISAAVGDILICSNLGMFTREIEINNTQLEIDLIPNYNQLDEIILTGTKEEILVGGKKISGNTHPSLPGGFTSLGDFYITAKDITPNSLTLERVMRNMFKGVVVTQGMYGERITIRGKSPQFVVDGFLLGPGEPPPYYISDNEIESIILKDSPNLTSRYSITPISGLVVIVTTKRGAGTDKAPDLLAKNNTYQEEVNTAQELLVSKKDNIITGMVTSLGKPLQGATITIAGSLDEYQSDRNGAFKVPAQEGDELTVRFLGMFPKGVTARADSDMVIDLIPKNTLLDEVTVSGDKSDLKTVRTAAGDKKESAVGYDLKTLTQEDIGSKYPDIGTALNGKFAGIRATDDPLNGLTVIGRAGTMLIIIDDQIFGPNTPRPFISTDRIKSISVTKGLAGSNRYGTLGRNGVVEIVTTSYATGSKREQESALVKGNDYDEENLGQLYRNTSVATTSSTDNLVRGVVRSEGKALQGATVLLKGTLDEAYTDNKGVFEISAQSGDVLRVNYTGMFPKEILVEPRNSNYNINLIPRNNALDEIVVQGTQRVDNTIQTGFGKEQKDKIGYAVAEIKAEDFNTGATSLRDLITGRFSGVTVTYNAYEGTAYRMRSTGSINNDIGPLWVVNGTPYQDEPLFLDVQQIASISALKGLKAVNKYGTIARGGAFVITTKDYVFDENAAAKPSSGIVSGNNYQEETIAASAAENEAAYITRLREIPNPNDQYVAYQQMARTQELSLEFYSDVARFFQKNNLENADKVRSDLAYIARNNTKALRTLAYLYEEAEDYKKMLQIYERVLTIAPQESQSYRDVANAMVANKQYNKALEMYRNMLGERVKGVNFSGIEPVLKTELSRLVQLYKDKIEFERLPNEWLRADFKQDVRMVIEWSDASVPFEFQFVNPQKKFFKWMHTLEDNRGRLNQEQKQGFQMEEFVIDDAPQGEWIINVQYLGEDSDYVLPPFLKYTIYRNYGTPRETKQVRILKIFKQSQKVTLGKIEI